MFRLGSQIFFTYQRKSIYKYQAIRVLYLFEPLQTAAFSRSSCRRCINDSRGELAVAVNHHAVAQDLHDQEEAGEEAAPEPADSLLDPYAHRQHHPVQRQAPPLAPHQARILSCNVF